MSVVVIVERDDAVVVWVRLLPAVEKVRPERRRQRDGIGPSEDQAAGSVVEVVLSVEEHARDGDRDALREHLRPQLEGLRKLHCEEGLKMAAWHGVGEEERDRYWSFMPKGAERDCENAS